VGVSTDERASLVAEALARLGASHALVVHAGVGMDEVSPSGPTWVWEIRDGVLSRWELAPRAHGLDCDDLDGLGGGEPEENAARIERLLQGGGAPVERCAVLLNAGAALYVSGNGWSLTEAFARAADALDGGAAARVLATLRRLAPRAVSTCG
jgi:anthranilate phosphoribosyltransferase